MSSTEPSEEQINRIIDTALSEDVSPGDITSELLIPPDLYGRASLLAKADGVLAGIEVAGKVFLRVDPTIIIETLIKDGTRIQPGDIIATISGGVISLLKAERVALNFLQRLSGIASQTAQYVAEVEGLDAIIADTRKTTPSLRLLEKYAVRMGGGHNHRLHLADGILIKDNHLTALRALGMSLKDIVAKARQSVPPRQEVEVEVSTIEEAREAVAGGADIIMLDNMSPDEMRQAVDFIPPPIKTEASGGINLSNVRAAAMAGVNIISIGALTHSPKALDISLEFEVQTRKLL
ncbi:carboxylating nicotinate-nucleotide diphosphorylase [Chloroflexota bacterium]